MWLRKPQLKLLELTLMTTTMHAPSVRETRQPLEHEWPPQGKWTYEDYLRLPDDGMIYEIIKGELHMSPAPEPIHQEDKGNLFAFFWNFSRQHDVGRPYDAPIDVILPGLTSPVQPDVLFIVKERLHIVKKGRIEGAPDIMVEVLSPWNWYRDRSEKFSVYAEAGVREYWIVDPKMRAIELFVLREN